MAINSPHKQNLNQDARAQSFDYDGDPRMGPGSSTADDTFTACSHGSTDTNGNPRTDIPGPSSASQRNSGLLEEQSYQDKSIGAQQTSPELDL